MISVIIPTYNSEKTIGRCLQALSSQTVRGYEVVGGEKSAAHLSQRFEIIVVDDGSIDKTAEIARQAKNVKFFQRPHKGPASARNFGAKMAHGDIILFTDADCEPDKGWIFEMSAPFNDESIAGVSGTYRTRQKEIIARFAQYEIEERHNRMAKMKSIDFIGTFSAGYRRKIFVESGGFDESFLTSAGEDPELSFRIAEKGHRMVFAPKAIVYHTHPDTIWKYLRQKYRNSCWRVAVYAKRKKAFKRGHSYTPASALWEAVFASLLPLLLILIYFFQFPYFILTVLIFTFLPSTHLIYYISKKDIAVSIFSPFIILARAFVTSLGIVKGLLKRWFE